MIYSQHKCCRQNHSYCHKMHSLHSCCCRHRARRGIGVIHLHRGWSILPSALQPQLRCFLVRKTCNTSFEQKSLWCPHSSALNGWGLGIWHALWMDKLGWIMGVIHLHMHDKWLLMLFGCARKTYILAYKDFVWRLHEWTSRKKKDWCNSPSQGWWMQQKLLRRQNSQFAKNSDCAKKSVLHNQGLGGAEIVWID